jgi:hypothetical protein
MIDRDALIDYLLHRMPESERLDFAERWFPDPDLAQQLEIAEAELMDAYVRAELPRSQRDLLERYLLTSDAQRRKLAFAAALHGILPRPKRQQIPWAAACAAAAIILLAGSAVWFIRQNQELRSEITKRERDVRPVAGGVYSASLVSNVRGAAGGAAVVLPKDASMLRLDLDVSQERDHQSYSATLSNSGKIVWKEEPLSLGPGSFVTMWIPASVLSSGKYTVALETQGNPIAYYALSLTR